MGSIDLNRSAKGGNNSRKIGSVIAVLPILIVVFISAQEQDKGLPHPDNTKKKRVQH